MACTALLAEFAGLLGPTQGNVTYQQEITTTSDANGSFTLAGIANNALWDLQVQISDPISAELFIPGVTDGQDTENLLVSSEIVSVGVAIADACLQLGELLLETNTTGRILPIRQNTQGDTAERDSPPE